MHTSFRRALNSLESWCSVRERTRCVPRPPSPGSRPKTKRAQVIDYRAVDLVEHLKAHYSAPDTQFDIIYDCAGFTRALYPASPAYLKPAGILVDICAMAMPEAAGARVRSFARVLERTWRPSWLGGTPRRYKAAVLLGHISVRRRFSFGYSIYCLLESRLCKVGCPHPREYVIASSPIPVVHHVLRLTLCDRPTETLEPILDSVFPFDEAPQAYARLMQGRYVRPSVHPSIGRLWEPGPVVMTAMTNDGNSFESSSASGVMNL